MPALESMPAESENSEKFDVGRKNIKSFEVIYREFYPMCYLLCLKILKNETDAEDAAQIAMMRIMQKIQTFEGRSALKVWIYRVIWNEAIGFMRKKQRWENGSVILENNPDQGSSDGSDPETMMLKSEMFELVIGFFENGNTTYKTAARLQLIEGLTNDEIFERLQQTEEPVNSKSTIRSRISRVRMELKEQLNKRGYGEHFKK